MVFRSTVRKREESFIPSKLISNNPQKYKDVQKNLDISTPCHVTPNTERHLGDNCGDFRDYILLRQGLIQSSNSPTKVQMFGASLSFKKSVQGASLR